MSKKTNAAKQNRQKRQQEIRRVRTRNIRKRRPRRPNPANVQRDNRSFIDKMPTPFKDPVFLMHVTRAMLRYLELEFPVELQIARTVDTEFPPEFPPDFCPTPLEDLAVKRGQGPIERLEVPEKPECQK